MSASRTKDDDREAALKKDPASGDNDGGHFKLKKKKSYLPEEADSVKSDLENHDNRRIKIGIYDASEKLSTSNVTESAVTPYNRKTGHGPLISSLKVDTSESHIKTEGNELEEQMAQTHHQPLVTPSTMASKSSTADASFLTASSGATFTPNSASGGSSSTHHPQLYGYYQQNPHPSARINYPMTPPTPPPLQHPSTLHPQNSYSYHHQQNQQHQQWMSPPLTPYYCNPQQQSQQDGETGITPMSPHAYNLPSYTAASGGGGGYYYHQSPYPSSSPYPVFSPHATTSATTPRPTNTPSSINNDGRTITQHSASDDTKEQQTSLPKSEEQQAAVEVSQSSSVPRAASQYGTSPRMARQQHYQPYPYPIYHYDPAALTPQPQQPLSYPSLQIHPLQSQQHHRHILSPTQPQLLLQPRQPHFFTPSTHADTTTSSSRVVTSSNIKWGSKRSRKARKAMPHLQQFIPTVDLVMHNSTQQETNNPSINTVGDEIQPHTAQLQQQQDNERGLVSSSGREVLDISQLPSHVRPHLFPISQERQQVVFADEQQEQTSSSSADRKRKQQHSEDDS